MVDQIDLVWGRGEATTELGAFDAALADAGIGDYNLVTYSSILPADTPVVEQGTVEREYPVGAPVGVVLAEHAATQASETVAAGLGWVTAAEGGVFMESTAASEAACREDLRRKLADARARRDRDWQGDSSLCVQTHTVDRAGAAVVAGVFGPLEYADF
jgi:arginine decarboxylase